MYAIVKSGGKQYHVEPGQRLLVERLAAEVGDTVTLEPLLYRSDEVLLDREALENVTVSATVLSHQRGKKLRVFKFKPKRGYRRRTGHRQELSRIEVREINAHAARGRAAAKEASPAGAEAAQAGAEAKPRTARRPRPAPAGKPQGAVAAVPGAGAESAPAGKTEARPARSQRPAAGGKGTGGRERGGGRGAGARRKSEQQEANEDGS